MLSNGIMTNLQPAIPGGLFLLTATRLAAEPVGAFTLPGRGARTMRYLYWAAMLANAGRPGRGRRVGAPSHLHQR
jgi:hypothetical protein